MAAGYRNYNPLEESLASTGIEFRVVGDAVRARRVLNATREGYDAGRAI